MTAITTQGTVLKPFQQDAVDNAAAILSRCLQDLEAVKGTANFEKSRRLIVGDMGAVLFEAPTGTGKTLMAGHVVEKLSLPNSRIAMPKILWFWFAPFAGLIDQSARVIRSEFNALRIKNPALDRNPGDIQSGDVYVTTWASVAVANEASRKARTSTEELPSVDALVGAARAKGFVIGAVIDEAHHSFRGQTQAFAFYKDVLRPEITILATATPKDKDVAAFCESTGIQNLRRITISRHQAAEARLIKEGVKVAVFRAAADMEGLIDFKRTALRQGVAIHRKLKELLAASGSTVVPLLLVQVESEDDATALSSAEQASKWLQEMGFQAEGDSGVIRIHTAKEPDPYFHAIAADESVEVLIFKMAAAIGFDAPRAFTLVSFRPSRDEDFGVQIVGRILRVDRRLQPRQDLPRALDYGYVFLTDKAGQAGLMSAAGRINSIKGELASVSSNVAVVAIDTEEPAVQFTDNGQIRIFTDEISGQDEPDKKCPVEYGQVKPEVINPDSTARPGALLQQTLTREWGLELEVKKPDDPGKSVQRTSDFVYPLQDKLGAPERFSRAVFSLDGEGMLKGVVARFRFDNDAFMIAMKTATTILMDEVEIFANLREKPEEIRAALAQKEIDGKATQILLWADGYEVIEVRELRKALLAQMRIEADRFGLGDHFDTQEKLIAGLNKILALRPEQLRRAISETVASHMTAEPTEEPLPKTFLSFEPLDPARLNLYGVFPADLNTWERPFAEYLDGDLTGTVLWWHRNPVKKPWSVSMPLPGQPDFYPDFIAGIRDRKKGKGVLLIETKRDLNDQRGNSVTKAQAQHPEFGKVMMIYWQESREWRVVEYDSASDKNILDRLLRPEILPVY